MPANKWIEKEPRYQLRFQPTQQAFLQARRKRLCPNGHEYFVTVFPEPQILCPTCRQRGTRAFDRLTLIAGRRFGKSRVAAIAGVEEACLPKSIGWACAPTNEKLHRYVIPAFQELIPKSAVVDWSIEHKDLRLKNGALIHFQTLEDPDQGRGQGLDWLYIDEIAELTQMHWDVIRPSLAGDTVAFFTTTPRGFDWVYKELFSKAVQGAPGYWAMQAKSIDSANPDLSAGFLDRERETMGSQIFQQEYEADFVTFTGSIYGDAFRDDFHTIRSLDKLKQFIPSWPDISGLPQLVGLDAGADHPFAAIRLVSTERGLIGVGEYLERNKSFYQHAQNIRTMCGGHDTRYAINRNDRQGIIELGQHGIIARPANNDQIAGIERVKSWLLHDQLFFVEWLCPQTLRQIKSYRWSEANTSERDGSMRKERVHKVDDDLMDCFVAGTNITTEHGDVPIEAVETGDLVLTRKGFKPVTCLGSRDVPTHRLTLSDGTSLVGTASHPIWVMGKGFTPLQSLRYGDMMWPCTHTPTTIDATPEPFGPSTTERFHPSTTSTTGTAIPPTTLSRIWNAFSAQSISGCTSALVQKLSSVVDGVIDCFVAETRSLVSALLPANPPIDGTRGWMTRPAFAQVVEMSSPSTVTRTPHTALDPARFQDLNTQTPKSRVKSAVSRWSSGQSAQASAITVVGNEPTGVVERVYNLAVDDQPEYFANGVLVHNCVRYAMMSWPLLPRPKPDSRLRDLSKLDEKTRQDILTMRRIDKAAQANAESKEGDEWGDFNGGALGQGSY